MADTDKCFICGSLLIGTDFEDLGKELINQYNCPLCGYYEADPRVPLLMQIRPGSIESRYISCWLRQNRGYKLMPDFLEEVYPRIPKPTIQEKAVKLLKYIDALAPVAGAEAPLPNTNQVLTELQRLQGEDPSGSTEQWMRDATIRIITECWFVNNVEYEFVLRKYMESEKKWIAHQSNSVFQITPAGWAYREELKSNPEVKDQIFVAMSFRKNLRWVYESCFAPAIIAAGYSPYIVGERPNKELIDNEIIAQIRQSKGLLADYTGNRPSVYYENGFAMGLGLHLIWTCQKDDFGTVKKDGFDVSHYPFIQWSQDSPEVLMKQITDNLLANLGRGTYVPEEPAAG